jgi:hypothetical protein
MSRGGSDSFFKALDEDGFADARVVEDGQYVDFEFRARVRKQDWDDYARYARSRGKGSGVFHLHSLVVSEVLKLSTDWRLYSGEVKSAFSMWQLFWYEKVARYLLSAHMTVLIVGFFVEQFLQTGSKSYIISQYLYAISLGVALLAYALLMVRKSFIRDQDALIVEAERRVIVWLSRSSGVFLVLSSVLFVIFSAYRLLTLGLVSET